MSRNWKPKQRVISQNESELGLGWIEDVEHGRLTAYFPKSDVSRMYSIEAAPIRRFVFEEGREFLLNGESELRVIEDIDERDGIYFLKSQEEYYSEALVVFAQEGQNASDLLSSGFVSTYEAYKVRRRLHRLLKNYAECGLSGLLSPRVELLEHQLYVAQSLAAKDNFKAILADEVGLGKTIEAGLIFSALKTRGDADRSLIVIPESLQTQWMSEFFRKFFEVVTWVDEERWEQDAESQNASSFALNDRVLIAMETLENCPHIHEDLLQHDWDLSIFDEAHKLCGEHYADAQGWTLAKDIMDRSRNGLLLSATPERAGRDTLEGLRKILGDEDVLAFRNRRKNFDGFPKRNPQAHFFEGDKKDWLLKHLSEYESQAKVLVLTQEAETALDLHRYLSENLHNKVALFTELQDFVTRDKQAAWFASNEGDSALVLVSSSLGGEGRNFQEAADLVLYDVPQSSDVLEQRIGRIDRIGQAKEINIHVPLQEDSDEERLFEYFMEGTRSFREFCPFAYLIENDCPPDSAKEIPELIELAQKAYKKAQKAYEKNLTQDAQYYRSSSDLKLKQAITDWEQSPDLKNALLGIFDVFGVEYKNDSLPDSFHIHSDALMFIENFPGLNPEENRSITFNRDVAISREEFDFVTVEHPFFEGATDAFFQSHQGKVGLCGWEKPQWPNLFLLHSVFLNKQGEIKELFTDDKGQVVLPKSVGFHPSFLRKLPKTMRSQVAHKVAVEVEAPLRNIEEMLEKEFPSERFQLDSFFIFLPMRG